MNAGCTKIRGHDISFKLLQSHPEPENQCSIAGINLLFRFCELHHSVSCAAPCNLYKWQWLQSRDITKDFSPPVAKLILSTTGPWHFPTFSILSSPSHLVISPGRPGLLSCATQADLKPEVRWRKDGLLLELPGSGRRLLANGSLVLEGTSGQGAGVYQCVVSLQGVGTLLSTPTRVTVSGISFSSLQ